ncbi:flavodoxin domain-containing protein [Helcobacillus massiliensis]|uniref:Menaquinone-dependent protoporphyrinogen IX oxidase n=1 Tax=Helcobacillus massiliensis TaxID=521392 RepID=A0A839QRV4_9MICO|nr:MULTISPECIES: flavodoxin domain-containing protein [Helcobacillus]MBB3023034.1 menaquinone-dependent protoporphyrinogen IX oxidase [Helcobacillus massiliensis]MCG7426047.1 flavodoxin domain-containing protein [Helcobacillus sp. ACRRO]MCT1558385.1 flavodoxin domain-containing protein [Helcobacillus massiliensis]MCT2036843.1 flavodoxin domain-containing protein [Helcobacillus massiliensis]MCT2332624.1 flavodoxin domain-containing protein [Helcobacillus massiliensis]
MTPSRSADRGDDRSVAILFASCYGHTRRYADWLTEQLQATGCTVRLIDARAAEDPVGLLAGAEGILDVIIGLGGNYGGSVQGMGAFADAVRARPDARALFATVAWASPTQTETIRKLHEKAIPADIAPRVTAFHLRGGIDHPRLSLKHRTKMLALKTYLMSKPESARTEDDRETLQFWGQTKDFTDPAALEPIVAAALAE